MKTIERDRDWWAYMFRVTHRERIRVYSLPELRGLLEAAGLDLVGAYGANSLPLLPYDADHRGRLVVIAARP